MDIDVDLNLTDIWVYLAQTPLLWLTLTLVFYYLADELYRRARALPLLNPVLIAVTGLVLLLVGTGTPYATYFDGAQFVHFMLGPATVALAIPLYNAYATLKRMVVPLVVALCVGSATGVVSAVIIGRWLGLNEVTLRSLAPKSITTPIAMGVSEQIGGLPSLTAVIVILTGISGAMFAREALTLTRIREESIHGFAMGLASHGMGTARAFQISAEAGAFAGLAMGLNGATTALIVPAVAHLLGMG